MVDVSVGPEIVSYFIVKTKFTYMEGHLADFIDRLINLVSQ